MPKRLTETQIERLLELVKDRSAKTADDDLIRWAIDRSPTYVLADALRSAYQELDQLQEAVKRVVSQRADAICWRDVYTDLAKLVGIEFTPELICDPEKFLANCKHLGGEIVEQMNEVERMAKTPRQQQEGILPTEGRIDTVSLTTGQAAEPREYPSYNPSAYKVNVAGAYVDILLDGHPGWWASIDEPKGLNVGMSVEFINSMSGKTLIRGKVSELVPPGTGDTNYLWEGKDFKDWWIIVYEVEDKRQDESDILKRMGTDSRKWAEEFKQARLLNRAIPFDDDNMTAWFANALMAEGNAVRELYKETPHPPKWENEKKPEPLPVKQQAAAIMQGVAAEDVIYRYMRDSLAEGITSFVFPNLCSLIGDLDATHRALDSLWRDGKIRISGVDAWELA